MCPVATLPCEMQMFKNDTNCAKLTIKSYHVKFHTCSISYRQCHKICSKYPLLTLIRAHRCVCHSLIAREFCIFQQDGALTYRASDTVWFLEQATSQFRSPDQTAPTLTQWTTASVESPMSTLSLIHI